MADPSGTGLYQYDHASLDSAFYLTQDSTITSSCCDNNGTYWDPSGGLDCGLDAYRNPFGGPCNKCNNWSSFVMHLSLSV